MHSGGVCGDSTCDDGLEIMVANTGTMSTCVYGVKIHSCKETQFRVKETEMVQPCELVQLWKWVLRCNQSSTDPLLACEVWGGEGGLFLALPGSKHFIALSGLLLLVLNVCVCMCTRARVCVHFVCVHFEASVHVHVRRVGDWVSHAFPDVSVCVRVSICVMSVPGVCVLFQVLTQHQSLFYVCS